MCDACDSISGLASARHASGYFTALPYRDLGADPLRAVQNAGGCAEKLPTLALGHAVVSATGSRRYPQNTPTSTLVQDALKRAPAIVAKCLCAVGTTIVYERQIVVDRVDTISAALSLADEGAALLSAITGEKIEKDINPLTPLGFLALVRRFKNQLRATTAPMDASLLQNIMDAAGGIGWFDDEAKREAMFRAIREAIPAKEISDRVLPQVQEKFSIAGKTMMASARESAVATFSMDIGLDLTTADTVAAEHISSTAYNFLRDSFGVRSAQMSDKARSIVSAGLESGFDAQTIAGQMERVLPVTYAVQQKGYLEVASMAYMGRARSRSLLNSYDEAGATGFRISAIIDEITSDVCRALNGHIIPVKESLAHNESAEAAAMEDPESIKTTMPWLSVRQGKDGPQITVPTAGGRKVIANGKDGNWTVNVKGKQFTALGISMPPYHGRCRTTTIPLFD